MEHGWLLTADKKRENARSFVAYLGVFAATATVIIFSTLFFADVSFSAAGTVSFSISFLLLFISSYMMYASLFETGRNLAEREESYKALFAGREALFKRFHAEGSQESLALFCKKISTEETQREREHILRMHFTSEAEIALWKTTPKENLEHKERRALRALERQRAVSITPRALLAERPFTAHRSPLSSSPERLRLHRTLAFLLPLAFFTLLSVSIACKVIANPSPDVIVGYLLKLFTLFQSGIKGFRSGTQHVAEDKCGYMHEQCELLEDYFKTLMPDT